MKETLGLQNHRHSRYISASDEFEPAYLARLPFGRNDEHPLSPTTALRRVGPGAVFLLQADHVSPGHAHEAADRDAIERLVAPHGSALVALYFRTVHPSYPVLHKRVFLEKYARSPHEFSPPLLAAVYALALQWWVYDPALTRSGAAKPDPQPLLALARKSLNEIVTRPKLSTVQAGLLLAAVARGHGDADLSAPTARLVALGRTLGLDRDCGAWRLPEWERGLRRRLGWALYLQDTWVALTHGRPALLDPTAWAVPDLSADDFPENEHDETDDEGSAEVEKGKACFMRMIPLTRLLAEILRGPYGRAGATEEGHEGPEAMLRWAKPLQARLKAWFAALPEPLRMTDAAVAPRKLSSAGWLHLAYVTAEVTLHRRIIRHLDGLTTVTGGDIELIALAPAVTACRAAARARLAFAKRFVAGLRPVDLQSFWYFPSAANLALIGSFGVLLWATASSGGLEGNEAEEREGEAGKGERAEVAQLLSDYRWALRVNAQMAEFVAEGLARVERVMAVVDER